MANSDGAEETNKINPLSPYFNPLIALYSPNVRLPFPQATIFNNLYEYERVLASKDRSRTGHSHHDGGRGNEDDGRDSSQGKVQGRTRRKRDEQIPLGTGFRATQEMLIDTHKVKPKVVRNAFTRMSELSSGPLSVLYHCMNERCKVRVCTRSFKGLRGICTGYLVAFDKFYNMALVDVDEVWRRPSTGQRFYHEEQLTFSKIMECSKMQEAKVSSKGSKSDTWDPKNVPQLRKEEKLPHEPKRHHTDRQGESSPSKAKDRKQSERSRHRGSEHHSRKKHDEKTTKKHQNRESERHRRSHKDLLKSKEKMEEKVMDRDSDGSDEDKDLEELQERLAALQRELTSLPDDVDAEGSPREMEEREEKDSSVTELTTLNRQLTALSDDQDAVESSQRNKRKEIDERDSGTRTKIRDSQSRSGKRNDQSDAGKNSQKDGRSLVDEADVSHKEICPGTKSDGSKVKGESHQEGNKAITEGLTEATEGQEAGQSTQGEGSKVDCAENKAFAGVKTGRLKIKPEDFQRRHVDQLFIRGDNVVLVSVDSNLLPK